MLRVADRRHLPCEDGDCLNPVSAVKRTIADRFGDLRRADCLCAVEVCDGAANFEYPIIGAGRQAQPRHRVLQHPLAFRINSTEAPDVSGRHLRVGENAFAAQSFALTLARRKYACADVRGTLSGGSAAAQLFEADGGHVYVYVYAVEERAGDAPDVALDLQRRAAAFARRVVPEPAGTSLRCPFAI